MEITLKSQKIVSFFLFGGRVGAGMPIRYHCKWFAVWAYQNQRQKKMSKNISQLFVSNYRQLTVTHPQFLIYDVLIIMKLRAHKEAADKARAAKLLNDQKAGPYVSPETAQYIGLHDKLKDQIAELDAQLAQLEDESSNYVEDLVAKRIEKGGDVEFLKLSVPAGQENAHRQQIIVVPSISQIKAAEHLQKEERRQVRDTGTKDYSSIHDADVFSTTRNCKPVETSHGVSSAAEQAFMYCWSSLPQDEDGFVMLDLDMIHDLFEYCGLFLTDHEAMLCMNQSPVNQLGRRHHKGSWQPLLITPAIYAPYSHTCTHSFTIFVVAYNRILTTPPHHSSHICSL